MISSTELSVRISPQPLTTVSRRPRCVSAHRLPQRRARPGLSVNGNHLARCQILTRIRYWRYDTSMIRLLAVFSAVLGIALTGAYPACVSNASPSDDTGQCAFVLTPPTVVQISGVRFATATMEPGVCELEVLPNSSVVCLSIEGEDSAGQCASNSGRRPAILHYTYKQGATYVVKGQGCADIFKPPYTICQNYGPSRVTL